MTIEKIKVQESSEEQEKKSEKQSKQKLPYEVVEDFYGPGSWKEMSKVLADRFGIENYKGTAEQNEAISKKLKDGEKIESPEVQSKLSLFSPEVQKGIRSNFKDDPMLTYIGNLSEEEIFRLNKTCKTPKEIIGFLNNQREKINKSATETGNEKYKNIVANIEVLEFDKDLEKFVGKVFLNRAEDKLKFSKKISQKAAEIFSSMEENKKQELIKSSGSEKEAIKKIERITALQLLQEEELEGMSEENLKEFDRLALQLYLIDENDLVLQSVWGENLLAYIQPKAVEEFYHNTDNGTHAVEIKKAITTQDIALDYINKDTENDIDELVDEENKDDQYRSNINKFFSKENTKESKEDIDKEKLKSAEEVLLKETNVAIKQQALNTCIDTLSSCLNIQLSDTENLSKMILEEKKLEQDNDGMTLKIDGNMNGKDVVIYYNLVSGELEYEEYLHHDGGLNTGTYFIDDAKNGRKKIPIQLPMLSEFKNEAESLPSQENMNNSKSVNEFIDTTKKQLDTKVKNKYRIDSGRYDFEKVMLQDMIAQEIGEFIEVDTRGNKEISAQSGMSEVYELCKMIDNTLDLSTQTELEFFRKQISRLKDKKQRIGTVHFDPITDVQNLKSQSKGEKNMTGNDEDYFFKLLFHKKNYMNAAEQDSYIRKENPYLRLFECFKSPRVEDQHYKKIDLDILSDYIDKSNQEVNYVEDNKGAWNRPQIFSDDLQRVEDQYLASASLDKAFDEAYETKT